MIYNHDPSLTLALAGINWSRSVDQQWESHNICIWSELIDAGCTSVHLVDSQMVEDKMSAKAPSHVRLMGISDWWWWWHRAVWSHLTLPGLALVQHQQHQLSCQTNNAAMSCQVNILISPRPALSPPLPISVISQDWIQTLNFCLISNNKPRTNATMANVFQFFQISIWFLKSANKNWTEYLPLSQCNHNKYKNAEWSCLRRGRTEGESKNSAKINPQSNAGRVGSKLDQRPKQKKNICASESHLNVRNDNLSLFFFHSGWICRCHQASSMPVTTGNIN